MGKILLIYKIEVNLCLKFITLMETLGDFTLGMDFVYVICENYHNICE
jgi:hypothetical protein